jgi:hypothetical protein
MLQHKLRALFNPENYHGWGKQKSYFEGWYFKLISKDEKHAIAIIPGIAMDSSGNKQSFIQFLDGKKLTAEYFKFEADDFTANTQVFEVSIANNHFSSTEISLDIPQLKGNIRFKNQVPWPNSWYSPGIMGPFAFVPFMECYHGVLSMDHSIEGTLEIDGKSIDFSGGRGYMEKDWGHSFPSAYVWMQSNHFSKAGVSIKASVANIPWLTGSFVGFIAGLYFDGQLIQFTTYNSSHLIRSFVDEHNVEVVLTNKKYRLELRIVRDDATELASPIQGFMDGRISESMTSSIHVKLVRRKDSVILLDDSGRNLALEVAGNIPEILKN